VYHIYAVRTADRNALQRQLQAEGVQTGLHYPIPVHLQEAHADLGYEAGDFPESEAAARETLSLPMFPEMTATQVDQVVAAVHQEHETPEYVLTGDR
jgi:dTDP-4-amino-4,6-dideoxygalactose transaminase